LKSGYIVGSLSEERLDELYGKGDVEYTPNSYFEKHIQMPVQHFSNSVMGGFAGSSVAIELAFRVSPKKDKRFLRIMKYL